MPLFRSAPALVAAAFLALPAAAGDLAVEVEGIRSDRGRVYVAIHRPAENVRFPDAAGMVAGGWRLAGGGPVRMDFRGLAPGRYAVNAFHDENGDGELDTNILGIPQEGYGFANDAAGMMGPPSFADASVVVGKAGAVPARITLSY